jgi:hypothetical protein
VEAPASPASNRGLLALGVGVVAGAVVVWILPLAGIALVWPVLFAVPGWVLVRRVAPDLPAPGAIGVAVVSSVYLSAHLVDVVARILGFGRFSILVSVVILVVLTALIARIRHRWLAPLVRPTRASIAASLRADAAIWLVATVVASLVAVVLFRNGWHAGDDGWISGGWNWSDLLVHVAIGSSILHGNFPPEVPYFAGVPLTYHWFADFHGAIASSAAGLDLISVYFATSALFAGVMALLVWALALRLTGQRRVAIIATILVCLGGGMGWLRLLGDLIAGGPGGDIGALLAQNPYDNSWADGWPFFRIASVLGTGFLPHRATTLGLPGLVAVVLLVVTCLERRPAGVLLAGVLAALLAPFQFYAFPATYLIVLLYVLATGAWKRPTAWRDALLFLGPIILAIPFIADAVVQQRDVGAFKFVAGWSEARFGDGPLGVLFFYATNLGLPFALALVSAVRSRGLPSRRFLVAWTVALFLVPNLVRVSAVDFDMNKYFQIMWIAVAILAAWLIRRWPRPAVAAVLAVSAISPGLILVWHLANPAVTMSLAQEAAGRWIEANTPERSVIVTDAFINSPVDLSGRLRITTFGPYVSNLGYDPAPREADVLAIYCDGPDVAAERMATYGATYVLSSGGVLDCEDGTITEFGSSDRFEEVYGQDGVFVWHLRGS